MPRERANTAVVPTCTLLLLFLFFSPKVLSSISCIAFTQQHTHSYTHQRLAADMCIHTAPGTNINKDAGAGAPDGTRHPDEESCDVSRRKGRQEASSMRAENVFECILSFYTVRWLFPSLRSKGWRCPDSLSPGSLDCCRSHGGGGRVMLRCPLRRACNI